MKYLLILSAAVFLMLPSCGEKVTYVEIETEFGTMKAELYNSTPLHRDNFVKLTKEGFYDDLLFHRIIKGFMVQGGDPDSKDAPPEKRLGGGGPGYQVDAEIGALHYKGCLAAARTGDGVNPERKSSGSQFYIVQGVDVQDQMLDQFSERNGYTYSEEERARYKELGGYPPLDNQYTVFGRVIEGLDVVDKIASVVTDPQTNRPLEDIKMKVRIAN